MQKKLLFCLGIISFVVFFLISDNKVAAQECIGVRVCQEQVYEYRCTISGSVCDPDRPGDCGLTGGTCENTRIDNQYNVNCIEYMPGACGMGCPPGVESLSSSCRFSDPPPPPPPPTGDPQPTVQPGWQGCGSCSDCGPYPSGECVTSPEGACLWDPSTCRYIPPPCYPSCSPQCGQDNGCGGTCAATDDGAPATPSFTSPSSPSVFIRSSSGGQITISWSAVYKADRYILELHASTNPLDSPAQTFTLATTTYAFTPTSRYYSVRVRSLNTSCGNDYSPWSGFVDFQVSVPVSGNIYYDLSATAGLSGNSCVGPTNPVPAEAGQLTVWGAATDGSYVDSATAVGNAFDLRLPYSTTGQNALQLQIQNSDLWMCSCPSGCSYPSGINAPSTNRNFYVLDATDPWFQTEGGPVAAYGSTGTVIQTLISPYCQLPACNPSMILNQNGGTTDGYVLTGGGEIDTSFVADRQTDQIDASGHNWFARLSDTPSQQDYNYFYKLLKLPPGAASDFGATASNAQKPTGDKANADADAYFHNGDVTITDAWDVAADESIVVLVNGNVNVNASTTVADGGFFMIVASGNITFSEELGHDDPTIDTAVVEGVFVANGQIRTPSRGEAAGGDRKFVGEGTFVGWNGFSLLRDYDDGVARRRLNNSNPNEFFRYRPDFLKNAPEEIKRPQYSWRELNP